MNKSCDICSATFEAKNNQKCCSLQCRKISRNQYALNYFYAHQDKIKAENKKYRDSTPERQLLKGARKRSKDRGEICLLTEQDIIIPTVCPVLQIPIERFGRFGPSLDRINSAKGYTKDNIWVISYLANLMKSNASIEELRRFAKWVKTL